MTQGLIVSLDGPGSSGKSSAGARAAQELGYRFLDTGVLYRGLTWLALQRGVDPADVARLVAMVPDLQVVPDERGQLRHIQIDGADVTDRLHTPDVEATVSAVSQQAAVRSALLPVQRDLARDGGIIMAGRDIGTVVLPDADLKLYLDASVRERARRRADERGLAEGSPEALELEADLRRRDEIDSTRSTAPLRVPPGAIRIGADHNRLEDTVKEIVDLVRVAERGR